MVAKTAYPGIYIELFGGFRARVDDSEMLELPIQQSGALLAYLVLQSRQAQSREKIASLFWPEEDAEAARNRLRQTLHALRRQLAALSIDPDSLLLTTRSSLQADPTRVGSDAADFEVAIRSAAKSSDQAERIRLLTYAVLLYHGPLLPDFYHDWFVREQYRLAAVYGRALHTLTLAYDMSGDLDNAIACACREVEHNPLTEETHCHLMRLYGAKGESSAVIRQFQALERILADELGVAPSAAARKLMETLRMNGRTEAAAIPSSSPSLARTPGSMHATTPPPQSVSATRFVDSESRIPSTGVAALRRRRAILIGAASFALLVVFAGWFVRGRAAGPNRGEAYSGAAAQSAQELWVAQFAPGPGDRDSEPTDLYADAAGNAYLCGFVQTTRRDVDFLTLKYGPDGRQLWQARYNGPGNDVDRARSLAVDSLGNVYVTGDSDNGRGNGKTRLSGLDYATVKYDRNGTVLWTARYNGPSDGEDRPCKVAVTPDMGVCVTGSSWEYGTGAGRFAIAIVKYGKSGQEIWRRRYAPDPRPGYVATDMRVRPDGHIVIIGIATRNVAQAERRDFLMLEYDGSGTLVRTRIFAAFGDGHDAPHRVDEDAAANIYVVGTACDPAHPGGKMGILTLKYGSERGLQWFRWHGEAVGPAEAVLPAALAADPDGGVWVAGIRMRSPVEQMGVVLRYDGQGRLLWAHQIAGRNIQSFAPNAAALDSAGNLLVTGGASISSPNSQSRTHSEYLTVKLAPDGKELWRRLYHNRQQGIDSSLRVAAGAFGGAYVSGHSFAGETNDIVTVLYGP